MNKIRILFLLIIGAKVECVTQHRWCFI